MTPIHVAARQIIDHIFTPIDAIMTNPKVIDEFDQSISFKDNFNKFNPMAFSHFADGHSYQLRRSFWYTASLRPRFKENSELHQLCRNCLAGLKDLSFHEFYSKYCTSNYSNETQVPDILLAQFRFAMQSQLKDRMGEVTWLKSQECSSMFTKSMMENLSRRAYLQDKKSTVFYLNNSQFELFLLFLEKLLPKNTSYRAQIIVEHGHQTPIDLRINKDGKQAIILDAAETISLTDPVAVTLTKLNYKIKNLYSDLCEKDDKRIKIQNDFSSCIYYSVDMILAAKRTENLHEIAEEQVDSKLPLSKLPPRFIKNGQSVHFLTHHPEAKNYKGGVDQLTYLKNKGQIVDGKNQGIRTRERMIKSYVDKFNCTENLDDYAALVERSSRSAFDVLEEQMSNFTSAPNL